MNDDNYLLLNPGPVPISDDVRDAMAEPMVSHRSLEFERVYERAQDALEYIFTRSTFEGRPTNEDGTVLTFNGTATMAMEATLAASISDVSDEVVSFVNGKFGRRFARIAEQYSNEVHRVEVEWGESFSREQIENAISPQTSVVTMVHSESSTGLLNPVATTGELAREQDALFVVDGVTSIGGDVFQFDEWNVDIAVTDAQKALAAPPGVSAAYLTQRAIERVDNEGVSFYQNVERHLEKADEHQTPYTSAVPLFRALAVAAEEVHTETMPTRIERHRRQSKAYRVAFRTIGLELFPNTNELSDYSNTLTAVRFPDAVSEPIQFFDALAEYGVSVSGGQAHLSGEIFRISNMGRLTDDQVLRGIETVGNALADIGADVQVEDATTTAWQILTED